MILGTTRRGDETVTLPANTITTIAVSVAAAGHAVKLAVFVANVAAEGCDVRGAIYASDGDLVLAGDAVSIAAAATGAWVDLPLGDGTGTLIGAGDYLIGVHAGEIDEALVLQAPAGAAEQAEAAFAGAPVILPSTSPLPAGLPVYLALMQQWTPPDVDDDYLAQLPWGLTQEVFAGGPVANSAVTATAGWYGPSFDPARGAFAIVSAGGPLADRVGERVRVTYATPTRDRSVIVWVRDERQFPDEAAAEAIVLSRAAWLRLAPLALDSAEMTVETIA